MSISRQELMDQLWRIHNDTSTLTTKDVLYRDLKIVQGIPIPGLPMLVENYLKREDSVQSIQSFSTEFKSHTVVLIGIDASKGVKRDIGIYSTDPKFESKLIDILKSSENCEADLGLIEIKTGLENISCFKQTNIKLTRKFILPLVNEAVKKTNV